MGIYMYKLLLGIATGYFIYTEKGRNAINNLGNNALKSIKQNLDKINNTLNNKNSEVKENARDNRIIQTDDE